jgi:hypothetical protein
MPTREMGWRREFLVSRNHIHIKTIDLSNKLIGLAVLKTANYHWLFTVYNENSDYQ